MNWRCLDCRKTWTGPAGEIVAEGRRRTLQLTATGHAVREHVLRFEHACVPDSRCTAPGASQDG